MSNVDLVSDSQAGVAWCCAANYHYSTALAPLSRPTFSSIPKALATPGEMLVAGEPLLQLAILGCRTEGVTS